MFTTCYFAPMGRGHSIGRCVLRARSTLGSFPQPHAATVPVQPTAFNFAVRIEQSAARKISVTVREDLDHGRRVTPQPPSRPAGWYRAWRAWSGGLTRGICRARGRPQAAGARQHRHPQRLCDDDGAGDAGHQGRRRAREGRRDRSRGPEAKRARRGGDQWHRHDRAAGAGRNSLAYVEYPASQHVG